MAALRPDLRLLGHVFTLRYVPAREDLDMQVDYDNTTNVQRLAVEAVGPDEVLVIDVCPDVRTGEYKRLREPDTVPAWPARLRCALFPTCPCR